MNKEILTTYEIHQLWEQHKEDGTEWIEYAKVSNFNNYLKVCMNSKCYAFCDETPIKFNNDFKWCPYCSKPLSESQAQTYDEF